MTRQEAKAIALIDHGRDEKHLGHRELTADATPPSHPEREVGEARPARRSVWRETLGVEALRSASKWDADA
jgi:hypothetical protein